MIWYKRAGFHSNPFSIKPAAFHDEVIGQNLKNIMDKVDKGGFVFIKGEYGTGKTTVLKRIINSYRGKGRLIYINLEFLEEVKVGELLRKRASFLRKAFRMLPRGTILLVDESQLMKKGVSKDIHDFFYKGFIKTVVFVGVKLDKKLFSKEVLTELKGSIISLRTLTPPQAVKIVRKRIGKVLLSDQIIKEIFSFSKNPRIFLENCEDVCKHVMEVYNSQADSEHVKAVLGKKKAKKKTKLKKRKKKKPKKKASKKVKKENKNKKEEKVNKGKEEEKKEIEFYVDTNGYPEYSFKQEF